MFHLTQDELLKARRLQIAYRELSAKWEKDEVNNETILDLIFTYAATRQSLDEYTIAFRKFVVGDGTWLQLREAHKNATEQLQFLSL